MIMRIPELIDDDEPQNRHSNAPIIIASGAAVVYHHTKARVPRARPKDRNTVRTSVYLHNNLARFRKGPTGPTGGRPFRLNLAPAARSRGRRGNARPGAPARIQRDPLAGGGR